MMNSMSVYEGARKKTIPRSSVFTHMVRLNIHVPEDLHTLRHYDRFSRMLVALFRMLHVIYEYFTDTPLSLQMTLISLCRPVMLTLDPVK